ncbi:recombination protein RecR [bacterium]|nr:recombination protein RecR [candidate division CSSED10-310 bacterium]
MLISELMMLPGIGRKSAQRIAFFLLKQPDGVLKKMAAVLSQVKDKIKPCERCFNLSEDGLCAVCRDERRTAEICVVQDVADLMAIEKTGEYSGKYHVLNGAISPMDGIGPENLTIGKLLERLDAEAVSEVILATNFTVEGEATAMYISRLLKNRRIKTYRIAHGLPVGGSLEYADEATMMKALEGKREI